MPEAVTSSGAYRVLARAYRPTRLSELIGQEALVRTLTNALATGRVAHAFLLTGIRGVGKTTTARIIARALNCTGADGKGEPTPEPCGVCPSCRNIADERPLDVIEMDAATRTGIDDIREIVEAVRYAPAASRYKIYIIDEVHMLSEKAFNGLLKTLEEPPPHAKFIFATTEVRKVPVTVLSRCQRFDLRRVEMPVLLSHLTGICGKESVQASEEALTLIARAAQGSVRDSLSLLDQAMALGTDGVEVGAVREMLGLADRSKVLDLFTVVMRGDTAATLAQLDALYAVGADPAAVVEDLLALAHGLSRLKVLPGDAADPAGLMTEGAKARDLAATLTLPELARAWQMLLRGLEEARTAPHAGTAAEMLLLRLACVSELPPPGELARLLRAQGGDDNGKTTPNPMSSQPAPTSTVVPLHQATPAPASTVAATVPSPEDIAPATFPELVAMLSRRGEKTLAAYLHGSVHVVRYEVGSIELRLGPNLPGDLPNRLGEALRKLTGRRWMVAVSNETGEPTLAEQMAGSKAARIAQLEADAAVRPLLDAFPGSRIVDVRGTVTGPLDDTQTGAKRG